MPKKKVVTYHLEMHNRSELRAAARSAELEVRRASLPSPELNRFLYAAVGGDWFWIDRLSWSYRRWLLWLERREVETWVGYVSGTPAGYFELEVQGEGSVEIAYFGLLPAFVGRGLGGALLTAAVERGFELATTRVWVHTCTLDHPGALANYEKRGFRRFKEEVAEVELPDETPGPWPGARS